MNSERSLVRVAKSLLAADRLPQLLLAFALYVSYTSASCADNPGRDSDTKNKITWAILDWPPVFMLKDGKTPTSVTELGTGYGDQQLREIITRLPNYQHDFVILNVQRIWAEIEGGHNLCFSTAFLTPEREKFAYFTPSIVLRGIGVVVRHDSPIARELAGSSTSLKSLLETHKEFRGVLEQKRSYGPVVDDILKQSPAAPPRIPVSKPSELLHNVALGRIDYTLEYPIVVEYRQRTSHFAQAMDVILIKELPDLTTGYVACTGSAWGRRAINDISNAIHDAAHVPAFRNAYSEWLPRAMVNRIAPLFDRFYDDLGRTPAPVK